MQLTKQEIEDLFNNSIYELKHFTIKGVQRDFEKYFNKAKYYAYDLLLTDLSDEDKLKHLYRITKDYIILLDETITYRNTGGHTKGISNTSIRQLEDRALKQAVFIYLYSVYEFNLGLCVSLIGIARNYLTFWRAENAYFNAAINQLDDSTVDKVEAAILKTALSGNVKAQSKILESLRPDKWADKKEVEHGFKNLPPFVAVEPDGEEIIIEYSPNSNYGEA